MTANPDSHLPVDQPLLAVLSLTDSIGFRQNGSFVRYADTAETHVVPQTKFVERPQPDQTPLKPFITSHLHWRLHVVKVHFDQTVFRTVYDFNIVPARIVRGIPQSLFVVHPAQ